MIYQKILKNNINYFKYAFIFSSSLLMMKNILITGSSFLYSNNTKLNILLILLTVFIYFYAIYKEKHFIINIRAMFILILIFIFWLVTFCFNTSLLAYSYVLEDIQSFMIYSIPAFLFLPLVDDYNELMNILYKIRYLFLAVLLFTLFLIFFNGVVQGSGSRYMSYSMAFGRALILPTIVFISSWFNKGNIFDLFCSGLFCLSIVLIGSRFPLLCIGSFILIKLFFNLKNNPKKTLLFLSLLLIIFIFLIFGGTYINNVFNLIFSKFGIRSRGLSILLSGNLGTDSGRFIIYEELISQLNKHPFLGYGAFGGIVALNNGLSHSLILDIFSNLGYLGGVLFLLWFISRFAKLWKSSKNNMSKKEYILICICMFAPICLIQSSLWSANYLWYLLVMPLKSKS